MILLRGSWPRTQFHSPFKRLLHTRVHLVVKSCSVCNAFFMLIGTLLLLKNIVFCILYLHCDFIPPECIPLAGYFLVDSDWLGVLIAHSSVPTSASTDSSSTNLYSHLVWTYHCVELSGECVAGGIRQSWAAQKHISGTHRVAFCSQAIHEGRATALPEKGQSGASSPRLCGVATGPTVKVLIRPAFSVSAYYLPKFDITQRLKLAKSSAYPVWWIEMLPAPGWYEC